MTKYLNDGAFTVGMPVGQRFRDNWDRVFGRRNGLDELVEPPAEFASAEPAVAVPVEAPKVDPDGTPGA